MRLKIWGKGLLKIIWVIFVILLVGLSFPQIYGMKCYSVMSGSMSPDLPVGSAIYVKEKEPEKVEKGEIITFTTEQGRTMITHRVAENNKEKHFFVTKGDSNQYQDTKPVKWENLQGTVVFCMPVMCITLQEAERVKLRQSFSCLQFIWQQKFLKGRQKGE